MKKTIYILLLLIGLTTYSQQIKFKTTGYITSEKNKKGTWSDWSKFKKSEMLITIDTEKFRIIVYSEEIQLFTITKFIEKKATKTDDIFTYICVDSQGVDCKVSMFVRKNQNNRKQLYIYYDDYIIVYNLEKVTDKELKSTKS